MKLTDARLRQAKQSANFVERLGFAVAEAQDRPVSLVQQAERLLQPEERCLALRGYRGIGPVVLIGWVVASTTAVTVSILENGLQRYEP